VEKITTPGFKTVYRLYDKETDKAIADLIALRGEPMPTEDGFEIFDPRYTWKRKTLRNYYAKELLVPIFEKGKVVYQSPGIEEIKKYCKAQIETLWEELLRFENPHEYFVDMSQKLWDTRKRLIEEHRV
jgi:nicotinate phosphoribosyltransferase